MNLNCSYIENSPIEKYVIGMKRVLGVLGISAALLLTFSCEEQLFTEYDDESFLTTTSLQDDNWELMPDYTFESGTSATDYMDFSLESSTGGAEGGPSYRLEIKNLLENGDFETGSILPWFYIQETGSSGSFTIVNSGSYAIDNNTARISLEKEDRAKIIFTDAFINSSTYVPNKSYFFKYDYRTGSPLNLFYLEQWDSGDPDQLLPDYSYYQAYGGIGGSQDIQSISNENTYPPLDPTTTSPRIANKSTASSYATVLNTDALTFAGSAQGGSYDNFRIVRATEGDFDLSLRLKMELEHNDDIELISGYYRFSVYVKAASLTSGDNSYAADRVELGIRGYDTYNQINVEDYQVFYSTQTLSDLYSLKDDGSYPGDWSSEWVELVLASEQTIQVPNISDDIVMELTISPSNPGITDNSWNRLSAGTILISEPKLEYSSEPW